MDTPETTGELAPREPAPRATFRVCTDDRRTDGVRVVDERACETGAEVNAAVAELQALLTATGSRVEVWGIKGCEHMQALYVLDHTGQWELFAPVLGMLSRSSMVMVAVGQDAEPAITSRGGRS